MRETNRVTKFIDKWFFLTYRLVYKLKLIKLSRIIFWDFVRFDVSFLEKNAVQQCPDKTIYKNKF